MRERLSEDLSEAVIKYLFEPSIKSDLNRSFYNMICINRAHLAMLTEKEIINIDDGLEISKGLNYIEEKGILNFDLKYNLEDLYFNVEDKLIQNIGIEKAGQLHTGRSRNDINATLTRMNIRDSFFVTCNAILELEKTILNLAKSNINTVMTGYTHMQPAEPITFSHYLVAILYALKRDFDRIKNSFETINYSPLGSGAMASTTFSIDRNLTADLLGFFGPLENSLDGIAARDYVLEFISAINIMANNLSRFSYDLYIWSTSEYSYVEVGDSVSVSSSIMPQKKNPITLEHIKSKSSHLIATLVSITSALKNTPYGHSRDTAGETQALLWKGIEEFDASIILLNETLKTIKINKEEMLEKAKKNYSTVTELANMLVRHSGISFRQAHGIVGQVVSYLISNNLTIKNIDQELIKKIAKLNNISNLNIKEKYIKLALDPIRNVEARQVIGGPSSEEVLYEIGKLEIDVSNRENWLRRQQIRITEKILKLSKLNGGD